MPYKQIFIGDSIYELYKHKDGRILLMRREFVQRMALGTDPPAIGQIEFESEEAFDEQLQKLIPNNIVSDEAELAHLRGK